MKSTLLILLVIISPSLLAQEYKCDEPSRPYWANGINSRVVGESPRIRQVYQAILQKERNISPGDGFITLQIHISSEDEICDIISFEIDQDYNPISFNDGKLVPQLIERIPHLTWVRKKPVKTYNLIRFKVKNGRITEIF